MTVVTVLDSGKKKGHKDSIQIKVRLLSEALKGVQFGEATHFFSKADNN